MNFYHSDIFSSEWWISITGMNINHSDEFLFQWGIFINEFLFLSSILTIIQSKPQPEFWLSLAQLSLSLFFLRSFGWIAIELMEFEMKWDFYLDSVPRLGWVPFKKSDNWDKYTAVLVNDHNKKFLHDWNVVKLGLSFGRSVRGKIEMQDIMNSLNI